MDFPSDSVLMSHMGEGNWKIARADRPVRLIKRPLGIGRLDDPPTFLFQYQPGPATLATLVSLEGERFRLVVAEGENLDSPPLPALEMPYGQFRPATGLRDCLNGWLAAGGPHHEVMNLGHHAADWEVFCQLAGHRVRPGLRRRLAAAGACAQAERWRSSRARRYSAITMSFSSWTEVSLASLSSVISPCCSRFTRSQISSTWP